MKLHILIIFFLLTQTIYAQEDTRNYNYIAGGTMNFSYNKTTYTGSGIAGIFPGGASGTRRTDFVIQPYIGKLLDEKWTLGVQLNYRIYRNEGNSSIGNYGEIGGGLFGRYTLNPAQKFNIYIQPSASYYHAYLKNERNTGDIQREKDNSLSVRSDLGVLYVLNEKFNLNLQLGGLSFVAGHRKRLEESISNYYTSFNANLRLSSLSFGLEFKF